MIMRRIADAGAPLSVGVEAELHDFGSAQHRARFVERLLPLGLGHRIVNDSSARLNVEHSVPDHRRP